MHPLFPASLLEPKHLIIASSQMTLLPVMHTLALEVPLLSPVLSILSGNT